MRVEQRLLETVVSCQRTCEMLLRDGALAQREPYNGLDGPNEIDFVTDVDAIRNDAQEFAEKDVAVPLEVTLR